MTIKHIKLKYGRYLPALDIDLLISHVAQRPRAFVLAHPEHELTSQQTEKLERLIRKRANNIPLAYLTGHKEFYGFTFRVNEHTLIPRPETELMCEHALRAAHKESSGGKTVKMIDIGTGSGCVIISLARLLAGQDKQPELYASDISDPALRMARQNAEQNQVAGRIEFRAGDLALPFRDILAGEQNISQLILTANLPYLTAPEMEQSPSISSEPKKALYGGKYGLELYSRLFRQLTTATNDCKLFCEISHWQTERIIALFDSFGFPEKGGRVHKDLAGRNRLVEFNL